MTKVARALALLIFGHEGVSHRLERMAWIHALAQWLRVRELMNVGLGRWPLHRKLPNSGVRYSIETFETLAVERTYFGNPLFAEIFSKRPLETFVDLGCNAGIFPCVIADSLGGKPPRGICVDANPHQVELAKRSASLNSWPDVHFHCGLVGSATPEKPETDFFLAPTSLGSSQFAYQGTASGHPLDWKKIVVPTLQIGPLWSKAFRHDCRCNILKIDIEGSEMIFLQQEAGFLSLVDSILIEWHVWGTNRKELENHLGAKSFVLQNVIEDSARSGLLYLVKEPVEAKGY